MTADLYSVLFLFVWFMGFLVVGAAFAEWLDR